MRYGRRVTLIEHRRDWRTLGRRCVCGLRWPCPDRYPFPGEGAPRVRADSPVPWTSELPPSARCLMRQPDPLDAHRVLSAWVAERVVPGTLMSLLGSHYLPDGDDLLWLEVTSVGPVTHADGRSCVEVSGWDIPQRARGWPLEHTVYVHLSALQVPGVLVHPFPPPDDGR